MPPWAQLVVSVAAGVITAAVLYIARVVAKVPAAIRKHTADHLQLAEQLQVNTNAIDLITQYLIQQQGHPARPRGGQRGR